MIIVDTLARNFGGGNENSTEDMNAFIERIDDLKDTYKSCMAIVHHSGHGTSSRARGSSVLPAAVDAEYKVLRKDVSEEMYVSLSQTLIKDGTPMKTKEFKFQLHDFVGQGVTSGALVEEAIPMEKGLNKTKTQIVDAVRTIQQKANEPAFRWVQTGEIIELTGINENTIQTNLSKLKKSNVLKWIEHKGYQVDDFDAEMFLSEDDDKDDK